jgi:hypothetical protein
MSGASLTLVDLDEEIKDLLDVTGNPVGMTNIDLMNVMAFFLQYFQDFSYQDILLHQHRTA